MISLIRVKEQQHLPSALEPKHMKAIWDMATRSRGKHAYISLMCMVRGQTCLDKAQGIQQKQGRH